MKNIKKKVSALVLTTVFATMQISCANPIDTGLGSDWGGAVINSTDSNFAGIQGAGTGTVDLNFNGNSHVNWDTLNLNTGETLNFNAVNGADGITVLNTVNQGMSRIYGNINANQGIGNLIISNPNGMLFNGTKFTTAGDAMITAQGAMMDAAGNVTYDPSVTAPYALDGSKYVITVQNSDFSVGGDLNFIAPTFEAVKSTFTAKNGAGDVKLTTTNGQDYIVTWEDAGCPGCVKKKHTETQSVRLEAIQVDGDVYIVSDKGIVKTVDGGTINGDLNVQSNGNSVFLNYVNNGNKLTVNGNVDVVGNGAMMYTNVADISGNLNMKNGGGFLEVNDINVGENMNLTTTMESENPYGYIHFTHVNGNVNVGGDANINSRNNIHIGNYHIDDKTNLTGVLLDGNLKVGGTLNAHAHNGHVMTTVDVQADKINFTSDNYNVLTSEDAVLTANEYSFKSHGYIGAVKGTDEADAAHKIIDLMEKYKYYPEDKYGAAYTKINAQWITDENGNKTLVTNNGTITNIETPTNAYIASYGDVKLTGANADNINITAYRKNIEITGPNVHATNINVGPETDYLKLDFDGRDFTTNYTNIRDEVVTTVKPDEVITYDLTNGPNGYNQPTIVPGEKTTHLVGPDPDGPGPGPNPPEPDPDPNKPSSDDNAKLLRNWAPEDPTAAPVNTPVAFAADLDDDEEAAAVRKNVDGSVTVVRAFPMMGS